jgi:drug/metabolite transporter (DMT)-like permease
MLIATLLYAIGGNAVKQLFKTGATPFGLAQLRIAFAFLWLLLFAVSLRRDLLQVRGRDVVHLAVFGCLALAGVQLSYYLAISRLNIAVATFIQFTGIIWVAGWERFRRRQPVSWHVWVALVLVIAGSFFMVGAYRPSLLRLNLAGLAISLIASLFFAGFLLRSSTLVARIDRYSVLLYGFGAGTLMWLVIDLLFRPALPSQPVTWLWMAGIGLLGTLVPFALEVGVLRLLRPSVVGILATAEPVFAGIIAYLFLKDILEPLQLLGAAVTCAGIVLVQARAAPGDMPAISPD